MPIGCRKDPEGKACAWTIAQVKSILKDETYIENSVHYRETNISYKNKKRILSDCLKQPLAKALPARPLQI